ncbi:MAG TPA: single-stranded DNA-binding protein [Firmicutes bacterium]|nr:single-stranded DNA-binding protein [Bacillota bacterium]
MLNSWTGVGRLTDDPQLSYVDGGNLAVCKFTLAVERRKREGQDRPEVDFIPVVVWGKQAESSAKYLVKGQRCGVGGRLQIRSYEARDGSKRKVAEIVAEQVVFLDRPRAAEETKPAPTGNIEDIEDIESDEEAPF